MSRKIDRQTTDGGAVHHITVAALDELDALDRTVAGQLAAARQDLAAEGAGCPAWHELTADERATSALEAWHYLRAARKIGLPPMSVEEVDTERLVEQAWPVDGPHTADSIASAADAAAELARYLAHATKPGGGANLAGPDIYRLVGGLSLAAGRLDQVLDQAAVQAERVAHVPGLYDDRRDGRDPALTVAELVGALDGARAAVDSLAQALADAHSLAGHLGHDDIGDADGASAW